MSNIWHDMNPSRISPDDFIAVIEIEKGSKKKNMSWTRRRATSFWTASCIPPPITRQTTALSRAPMPTTATRWTCWCSPARPLPCSAWCGATPLASSPCWTRARWMKKNHRHTLQRPHLQYLYGYLPAAQPHLLRDAPLLQRIQKPGGQGHRCKRRAGPG